MKAWDAYAAIVQRREMYLKEKRQKESEEYSALDENIKKNISEKFIKQNTRCILLSRQEICSFASPMVNFDEYLQRLTSLGYSIREAAIPQHYVVSLLPLCIHTKRLQQMNNYKFRMWNPTSRRLSPVNGLAVSILCRDTAGSITFQQWSGWYDSNNTEI